jgi:hypothetical protein
MNLFVLSLLIALVAPLQAATGGYPSTPKAVIEKYLQLDAEAAGLSESTWAEMGPYVAWLHPPPWDTFVVIDRYEITKVIQGSTRAQAWVTYHPIGRLSDTFAADTQLEKVVFYLNKVKGQWKVDSPVLTPHVSVEVMTRRLEAKSASDPKVKKANDDLLNQIMAARQSVK